MPEHYIVEADVMMRAHREAAMEAARKAKAMGVIVFSPELFEGL